jgi:hypothetical protein
MLFVVKLELRKRKMNKKLIGMLLLTTTSVYAVDHDFDDTEIVEELTLIPMIVETVEPIVDDSITIDVPIFDEEDNIIGTKSVSLDKIRAVEDVQVPIFDEEDNIIGTKTVNVTVLEPAPLAPSDVVESNEPEAVVEVEDDAPTNFIDWVKSIL